jgi:aryl-alcohol dehydrogenase-like predicted oxidoreductase
MEYRYLGNTGLKVSVISFGAMLLGSDAQDKDRLHKMVHKAWEAGINFFDTAEF